MNGIIVQVFLGLAAGIGLAEYADWIWLGICLLGCMLILLLRPNVRVGLAALAVVLGFGYWTFIHPVPPPGIEEKYIQTKAVICDFPSYKDGNLRFTVWETGENGLKLRVVCRFYQDLKTGDEVELRGQLRAISPPSNPGEFDYQEYMAHRNVFFNLVVQEPANLKVIGNQANWAQKCLDDARERGFRAIAASMDPREAVLLEGMLFGFQGQISEEDMVTFQETGLIHIFSVSGFHVGFIILLGTYLAAFFQLRQRGALLLTSALILLYGFLTAWPTPLLRAAVMAWLALVAYYLGRENDPPTALALAGILLLLWNPANLFEISWQLSFLATWGIVYLYPRIMELLGGQKTGQRLLAVCLAPQIAVLPMAAYYFNLFSLISVLANLILVEVAGLAVLLGFMGIILAQFSLAAVSLLMVPAGLLTRLITWCAGLLQAIPGSHQWVAQAPPVAVVLAYAGIILLTMKPGETALFTGAREETRVNKLRKTAGAVFIAAYLLTVLIPGQWRNPGSLQVVFLDVGQGDSVFIKTARGRTILVDGGGSDFYDVGGQVVLPYLRRQGITRLDLAIASHPHKDHLLGWLKVLEEYSPRVIMVGEGYDDSFFRRFKESIVITGYRRIKLDDTTTLQLWGTSTGMGSEQAQTPAGNDLSLVVRIVMDDTSFLLTGDATQLELDQLERQQKVDWGTDVLKVPHHGSGHSWSESFINKVDPAYAVISVGERNPYGHPDPDVINQMEEMGIEVYRTDQDGAVTFITDGRRLQVQTVIGDE